MGFSNDLTNNSLVEVGSIGFTGDIFVKKGNNRFVENSSAIHSKKLHLEKMGIPAPINADEKHLNTLLKKATKKTEITTETVSFSSDEPENKSVEQSNGFSLNWKWYALGSVIILGLGTYFLIKKINHDNR